MKIKVICNNCRKNSGQWSVDSKSESIHRDEGDKGNYSLAINAVMAIKTGY